MILIPCDLLDFNIWQALEVLIILKSLNELSFFSTVGILYLINLELTVEDCEGIF